MAESIYSNRARKKGIAAPYAMHAMAASLSSSLSKTDEDMVGPECFVVRSGK